MKNFNRRQFPWSPWLHTTHYTHYTALCVANWSDTHTHVDRTHSLTQLQPRCVKRQFSYYKNWNEFIF